MSKIEGIDAALRQMAQPVGDSLPKNAENRPNIAATQLPYTQAGERKP
jgi:hypothetical protein